MPRRTDISKILIIGSTPVVFALKGRGFSCAANVRKESALAAEVGL
ncbi:MAG TPA: hypothetical protein VMZ25_01955 [Terriglobales bacterium]|nr:hypothetical protein [Terriglobales bacterium]